MQEASRGQVLRILTSVKERENPGLARLQDRTLACMGYRVLDYLPSCVEGSKTFGVFVPEPPIIDPHAKPDFGAQKFPWQELYAMRGDAGFTLPPIMQGFEPSCEALGKCLLESGGRKTEATSICNAWHASPDMWGAIRGVTGVRIISRKLHFRRQEREGADGYTTTSAWTEETHKELRAVLREDGVRFIVLHVSIELHEGEDHKSLGGLATHANSIVFDKANKRVTMFDPHLHFAKVEWDGDGHHAAQLNKIWETLKHEDGKRTIWKVQRIEAGHQPFILQTSDSLCQSWVPFLTSLIILNPNLTLSEILGRVRAPQYELSRFLAATHIAYTRSHGALPTYSMWDTTMKKTTKWSGVPVWVGDEFGDVYLRIGKGLNEGRREPDGFQPDQAANDCNCTENEVVYLHARWVRGVIQVQCMRRQPTAEDKHGVVFQSSPRTAQPMSFVRLAKGVYTIAISDLEGVKHMYTYLSYDTATSDTVDSLPTVLRYENTAGAVSIVPSIVNALKRGYKAMVEEGKVTNHVNIMLLESAKKKYDKAKALLQKLKNDIEATKEEFKLKMAERDQHREDDDQLMFERLKAEGIELTKKLSRFTNLLFKTNEDVTTLKIEYEEAAQRSFAEFDTSKVKEALLMKGGRQKLATDLDPSAPNGTPPTEYWVDMTGLETDEAEYNRFMVDGFKAWAE